MTPAEVASAAPFPLAPIELATALVFGTVRPARPLPPVPEGFTIREAIERVITEAHVAGPVSVSFSGGRDSSVVLAIADHVARREGFPRPVPITLNYVGSAAADEREWQKLVLDHLGLTERIVIDVRGELDLVGEVACSVMRRHGLLWPSNGFAHDAMMANSHGFTLLTGGGGDELLEQSLPTPTQQVLAGRRRPTARDVARLVASLLAPRLYDKRQARFVPTFSWLTSAGQAEFARRHAADLIRPHATWSRSLKAHLNGRSFAAFQRGMALLALDHGARTGHPFLDPVVLAAAAREGGKLGLGGRTNAMRLIASDLLPEPLIARTTKASFGDGFWARESRAFMVTDEAVDVLRSDDVVREIVDLDALRAEWMTDEPHFLTSSLLQAAHMSLGRHESRSG